MIFFIQEGVHAKEIGFLTKGIVRAFFLNQEGKEYTKQFFVNYSIIGAYSSLLTKQANKIAQQALTDCELVVADFREIEKLFDKFHDLERLARKIAEFYFLEKEEKEIENGTFGCRQEVFDYARKVSNFRSHGPTISYCFILGHLTHSIK